MTHIPETTGDTIRCCICNGRTNTMIFVAAAAPIGAGKWYCQIHNPATPADAREAALNVISVWQSCVFPADKSDTHQMGIAIAKLEAAIAAAEEYVKGKDIIVVGAMCRCPSCRRIIGKTTMIPSYCHNCGQRIAAIGGKCFHS